MGTNTEEQAVDLFDNFIWLLNEDTNFKQYKIEQLKSNPQTLSKMEMFAFKLICISEMEREQMHKVMTDELEYDPLNPILYSYDKQIRETLENLFFGEFIHKMLELPAMRPVRVRQKESGRIANIDKPLIIERIQSFLATQESMSQFKKAIDIRYVKVKMDLLLGKGERAFEQYLMFNTNITANEILGLEREQEAYEQFLNFMDMFKRTQGNGKNKK